MHLKNGSEERKLKLNSSSLTFSNNVGPTAGLAVKTARVNTLVLLRQQDYDQKTTDTYLSLSSGHVNARRAKMSPW